MSTPNWKGRTALIVASGPSLEADDVLVADTFMPMTIAVNSSHRITPAPDVVYGGDFMWWKMHVNSVRTLYHDTPTQLWTSDRTSAERFGLQHLRGANGNGLNTARVNGNGNSGAQAINLAYLFGARRIVLLGFDMAYGPAGEKHWHPDHPKPCVQAILPDEWLHKFEAIARDAKQLGVEIINCTRGGRLECFPRKSLEEALCPAP